MARLGAVVMFLIWIKMQKTHNSPHHEIALAQVVLDEDREQHLRYNKDPPPSTLCSLNTTDHSTAI